MYMRIRMGLFIALFLVALIPRQPVTAAIPTAGEIDAVFADYDNTTTPGCALGVVRDGELVYSRGYGMANLEYGIALSPTSVFRTGSVGKQFTAMAIALLAEEGTIDLDDPIAKLFPEFPAWADEVTIRHLVHHASGIRDYLTLTWLAGMGDEAYYTDEFAIELLSRQEHLNFAPGEEYLYSNSGYLLLAHVVHRATGQTLRQWADRHLFGPLDMQHSHFHDDHTHVVPNRADGYAPDPDEFKISMTTLDIVGDGGVYTTIEDLLLWDRNFYDNRLGRGGPRLIEQVTTTGTLRDGESIDYAFGLRVTEYRGLPLVAHGGAFVGFRADSIRFPDQRLAVYVLCNRADANPGTRSRRVAELYLTDEMEPEAEPGAEIGADVETPTTVPAADLERLAGWYWSAEERDFQQVLVGDGRLVMAPFGDDRFEPVPLSSDRFALETPWGIADLSFEVIPERSVTMTYTVRYEDDVRHYERFEPVRPSAADLSAYTGTFYSPELDVEYILERRQGRLVFGIDRPGELELQPRFGERFESPEYGIFTFARGSSDTIVGFALDAGRVRDLKFVRR